MISSLTCDLDSRTPRVDGKFLSAGTARFLIKGAAYGTFAPDAAGVQFPATAGVARDFAMMAAAGINTVRTYTVPPIALLDEAARHGLRVMVGIPWAQHIPFLEDRACVRAIRDEAVAVVSRLAPHPAALLFAVGNEIPPPMVRWYGQRRVERFLRELYYDVKAAAPESLLTYVNFPPTEYLDLDCFDVASFNVYLHRESDLRAYLARLQHVVGHKPLLLAEAGADSIREGLDGQARITAAHIRTAFSEGACGAIAFAWTDEWWRGGHQVGDWAFGLVDADRHPKPALAAVSCAFADAPFPADERAAWPKVSVVVCAFNAADTIADCLESLEELTYPDTEIIVVNDGSRDKTAAIARRHPTVRLIEVPNRGLSAARNTGLAAATGDIVAYTDADVRVDRDWLTYLVQPIVTSGLAASGGPNVPPRDDPFVAQCVARAPGGPTHVMLDDRIAEHVPGCNMAFRREALLSIGGFNPVYLRAGDDVDVCWRLQAKGFQVGFSPSALVWHHHRTTVKAYWRQQVGYGEGETWLDAHHPEKFFGGQMLWRGRIYSPLPFVRSLSGQRVNTGIWGTAAFPSVYRTEAQTLQLLPHSLLWMLTASALCVGGGVALLTPHVETALILLGAGVLGWTTTVLRCAMFAKRSDLLGLRRIGRYSPIHSRFLYRTLIAWLHLVQPLARAYGRARGILSPPQVGAPEHVTRVPWKAPVPSMSDAGSSAFLLMGGATERSFWSEGWTDNKTVLTELAGTLRASRPARLVDSGDGWHADRDLSIAVGRWGWLHVRALVEEHEEGRCLLRLSTRLRPSFVGAVRTLALALLLAGVTSAAIALRWPSVAAVSVLAVATVFASTVWQTTRATAVIKRAVSRVTSAAGMMPLPLQPGKKSRARLRLRPATTDQVVQAAMVVVLAIGATISGISFLREFAARRSPTSPSGPTTTVERPLAISGGVAVAATGEVFVADARQGLIRRFHLSPEPLRTLNRIAIDSPRVVGRPVAFASAADLALAPNGDLYVADPQNNRICRIDRTSGKIVTVAGSGVAGYSGDSGQATQAALHGPRAVAVAPNGDLYIADTLNHRVRVVTQATGVIRTLAGNGPATVPSAGDGAPAAYARLNTPSGLAVAADGTIYIADTGHHRIRRIDASTGVITTVGTMAIGAPTALALVPAGRHVVVYFVDSFDGAVRTIGPDGRVTTFRGPARLISPVRLAYRAGGPLYVKDASPTGVTALPVPNTLGAAVTLNTRPPVRRKVA